MNLDFEKITVEQVDIIAETERTIEILRKHASEVKSAESMEQYDEWVRHSLMALGSVINLEDGEDKRLIYQKNGFSSPNMRRFISLEMALKEIYGGD